MSDPSPRRYRVGISAAQLEQLKSAAVWAGAQGVAAEYVAALKEIQFRLSVEPADWGTSRERLAEPLVQMRRGTSRMVTVLYGVAEDADAVFVKEFRINRAYTPPQS